MTDPASYREVIVTDRADRQHRYPMATAPAEDEGHNLHFLDGEGQPVHWAHCQWAGWTLSAVPVATAPGRGAGPTVGSSRMPAAAPPSGGHEPAGADDGDAVVEDAAHEWHRHTSGDGFVRLPDGSVRWGRFGAAGVLARTHDRDGRPWYFLARRSRHTHQGGTWAMPGGALNRGEAPLAGALREFAEEIGRGLGQHRVALVHEDDQGGWSYWTLVVDVPERFEPPAHLGWETAEARWVAAEELGTLDLFDAFRATLGRLGLL